jgi:MFS family permease
MKFIIKLGISSCLGGLLFGYDTGVIGGVNLFVNFKSGENITNLEKETIVSIAILGAVIGSFMGGIMTDNVGRKKTIVLSDLFFIIGGFQMYFCTNLH